MTNVEGRVIQLELAIKALQAQLAAVLTRLAAAEQLGRSNQGITYNWGGGGSGSGAFVAITPTIAAGGSGTANVSQLIAGAPVLFAAGATIWNPYLSATIAGRIVTLCQNPDQSYTIYAQSCA